MSALDQMQRDNIRYRADLDRRISQIDAMVMGTLPRTSQQPIPNWPEGYLFESHTRVGNHAPLTDVSMFGQMSHTSGMPHDSLIGHTSGMPHGSSMGLLPNRDGKQISYNLLRNF